MITIKLSHNIYKNICCLGTSFFTVCAIFCCFMFMVKNYCNPSIYCLWCANIVSLLMPLNQYVIHSPKCYVSLFCLLQFSPLKVILVEVSLPWQVTVSFLFLQPLKLTGKVILKVGGKHWNQSHVTNLCQLVIFWF